MDPIEHLSQWLQNERAAGAPNPQQAVLSTATMDAVPHSRVVAIREIDAQGLLFFTQKDTRKVAEMSINPAVSMTFWFELLLREVIIEGTIEALSEIENEQYWQSYPREAQIRFHSYAPTSAQPIRDKQELEEKRKVIQQNCTDHPVPVSPLYCGFRLKPNRFIFYAYRSDELSDVLEYTHLNDEWTTQLLSP
ncbi:MAG TPA: pyridoxamine 5'-phosphate oxidase [Legionella sp.]|nr:pyridoxamine 5'-phosphate oxidase [Legionella sp.]